MTQVIEVRFKGNRKDFFLWEPEEPPALKGGVIVDADRGEDLGYVHATGEAATHRNQGTPHGYGGGTPSRKARRLATTDDVRRERDLRAQDDDARRRAAERVRANDLAMKVSDAEWQWDRKKLTLYFTADRRVDFRTLVRELAAMFRTRIELKQIGVRDEAKRLDGIGRCGRQYCSASWLPELRPVNLGVAKDQRLSLNPSQISGACGRLMCCLRYEHEFYVTSRRRFPKEGKVLQTSRGAEKVIANDIFRERVVLRGEDGESRTIPLDELRQEMEARGTPLPVPTVRAGVGVPRDDSAVDDDALGGDDSDFDADADADEDVVVETVPLHRPSARTMPAAPPPPPTAPRVVHREAPRRPAPPAAEAPAADAPTNEPPSTERRTHRRRGRRGGRRNRGRGGESPEGGGPPTTGGGGGEGEAT
jgi:cell fate regulator YaaT (PSP1 superfamily)